VARRDNGPGPCFAFNSHIDTVPVGTGWTADPFRLTPRGDKLHARGACDAKGSITAMVEAGRLLLAEPASWRGTLLLTFVADEEIGGAGSQAVVAGGPPIDVVVVGEPTRNAVFAAHKGCVRPLIRVAGRAAHSGRPELGKNAILDAGRLLQLLDARDQELRTHHHPLVGKASLTVTRIAGGIGDNIVPDQCDIVLDQRLIPGESLDTAVEDLKALLARARREQGIEAELVHMRTIAGSAETALDQPIVREALAASSRHGVTVPQPAGLTGGCDLVHFRTAGSVGIILGPGSLDVAHQPDEYVPADDLTQAALIYRDVARAMLRA
jgi:acetylornithine deacetylase/succinyl-diaminopimelate desuccinylase